MLSLVVFAVFTRTFTRFVQTCLWCFMGHLSSWHNMHDRSCPLHRWQCCRTETSFDRYNQHVWPRPIYTLCARGSNVSQGNVELYVCYHLCKRFQCKTQKYTKEQSVLSEIPSINKSFIDTGKQRGCVAPGVPLVMATAPGPHAQLLHNMCQRRYWDTLDIRQYLTRIDKPPRLRLEPSQGAR
jgi:hypothetical protein